jgi:hypothetical protein
LHGQRSDGRGRMTTLSEQGFDICLQAGATTWVVAGETEDNGARAVDIHGARAYHQSCFFRSQEDQKIAGFASAYRSGEQASILQAQAKAAIFFFNLTGQTALSQCIALKRPF